MRSWCLGLVSVPGHRWRCPGAELLLRCRHRPAFEPGAAALGRGAAAIATGGPDCLSQASLSSALVAGPVGADDCGATGRTTSIRRGHIAPGVGGRDGMISYPVFCQIRELHEQKHLTVPQIAAELALDPKTVAKWVERAAFQRRAYAKRPSKLDSFKGQIVAQLERHPYTAQQLLQQLQTQGYAGGYTILKEFVRLVRPVRKPAFLMLEFAPGECAQVDWGSFGFVSVGATRRRLSFFVMVLCHSRMMYVEFTLSEGMEHFLSCHRHALEFFRGSPAKVMIDNLKVGVLDHPRGDAARFNPRYLDFAAHYGFSPVACQVAKGNEKGRVENGVGYVKKNFLNGLDIPAFTAVNPAARLWLDTVANVRLHGETHCKPLDRFAQEKPSLRPLPAMPYDCAVIRSAPANACCRVVLDTNRYTVPHLYASQKLTLKLYPDQLLVYHHEKLIATHLRCYDRRQDIRNPDHIQD